LRRQRLASLETIVVVNRGGDPRADAEWTDDLAGTRVIVVGSNLGFAAGVNRGVRASNARYVLVLNDDAWADEAWAGALVAAAERDSTVGMCASKVLLADPPGRIDTTGHQLFADGLNRGRGRLEIDRGQYDSSRDVLFPSGAAALYRRSLFDVLGGFDERFFAYGEDTELGIRARLAGWTCRYVPEARAWHHGSLTAGAYSAFKGYHVERNRVWLVIKHFPVGLVLANPLIALARHLAQAWGVIRGRGASARFHEQARTRELVWTALSGLGHGWAGTPRMLFERWRLRRERHERPAAVYGWLRRDGATLRRISWTD
jgi:GT2 family glycosyltransferase